MVRGIRVGSIVLIASPAFAIGSALAASVPIPNFSFETYNNDYFHSPADWTPHGDAPTGYTVAYDNPGTLPGGGNNNTPVNHIPDGSVVGSINFDNNNGANGTPTSPILYEMSNSASLGAFAANTTYTLNAYYGGIENSNSQYSIGYGLSSAPLTLATLNAANSTSINDTALPAPYTMYQGPNVVIDTATNPSLVGQPIYVSLFVLDQYAYGRAALYDKVTLDATTDVPEPVAGGATLLSAGGLLLRRRRASA